MPRRRSGRVGHAWTYEGRNLVAALHRARRDRILQTVRSLGLPPTGTVADFGCSDGYILMTLRDKALGDRWDLVGLDRHCEEQFRSRLPDARFVEFDLNLANNHLDDHFDLVCCFETLEHVGDFRAAVDNLMHATKPNGRLVLSLPNERGLPGLAKYVGRRVFRQRPYGDFFSDWRDELRYVWTLVTGGDITSFRQPPRSGWGPHLGFDWRQVIAHLSAQHGLGWVADVTKFGTGVIVVVRPDVAPAAREGAASSMQ